MEACTRVSAVRVDNLGIDAQCALKRQQGLTLAAGEISRDAYRVARAIRFTVDRELHVAAAFVDYFFRRFRVDLHCRSIGCSSAQIDAGEYTIRSEQRRRKRATRPAVGIELYRLHVGRSPMHQTHRNRRAIERPAGRELARLDRKTERD